MYTQERKSECSYQESSLDLPITISDALPLSYRRLMGAKDIKGGTVTVILVKVPKYFTKNLV